MKTAKPTKPTKTKTSKTSKTSQSTNLYNDIDFDKAHEVLNLLKRTTDDNVSISDLVNLKNLLLENGGQIGLTVKDTNDFVGHLDNFIDTLKLKESLESKLNESDESDESDESYESDESEESEESDDDTCKTEFTITVVNEETDEEIKMSGTLFEIIKQISDEAIKGTIPETDASMLIATIISNNNDPEKFYKFLKGL
jgi:hypothetical protein